jgi:hypothetical protein
VARGDETPPLVVPTFTVGRGLCLIDQLCGADLYGRPIFIGNFADVNLQRLASLVYANAFLRERAERRRTGRHDAPHFNNGIDHTNCQFVSGDIRSIDVRRGSSGDVSGVGVN